MYRSVILEVKKYQHNSTSIIELQDMIVFFTHHDYLVFEFFLKIPKIVFDRCLKTRLVINNNHNAI